MIIQYVDIEKAGDQEDYIKSLIEKTASKLDPDTLKDSKLIVDLKEHEKEGSRKKFSFHIKLEAPSTMLSAHADDWDLVKATHKVLDNLENEFQHKFKTKGAKFSKSNQ